MIRGTRHLAFLTVLLSLLIPASALAQAQPPTAAQAQMAAGNYKASRLPHRWVARATGNVETHRVRATAAYERRDVHLQRADTLRSRAADMRSAAPAQGPGLKQANKQATKLERQAWRADRAAVRENLKGFRAERRSYVLSEGQRPNDTLASRSGRQGVVATRLAVPKTVGSVVAVVGGVAAAPAVIPAQGVAGVVLGAQRSVVGGLRAHAHAKDKMHTAAGHLRHEVVTLRTDPAKVAQPTKIPLKTRFVAAILRKTPESRPTPGPSVTPTVR